MHIFSEPDLSESLIPAGSGFYEPDGRSDNWADKAIRSPRMSFNIMKFSHDKPHIPHISGEILRQFKSWYYRGMGQEGNG